MRRHLLSGLLCYLSLALPGTALAEDTPLQGCPVMPMLDMPALPPAEPGDPRIEILTGRAQFDLNTGAELSGEVLIRRGDSVLSTPSARYDSASGLFTLDDGLRFRDPDAAISGERASFDTREDTLRIEGAEFQLFTVPSRGSAASATVESMGKLRLKDVAYTTCAPGKYDWVLRAGSIDIDRESGIGTARNARLEFQGVPILYTPWISYPVTNERKTGFLLPEFGRSETRGLDVRAPYYLNLAPNYDLTLTPRYMDRRGVQLNSEFRYLWPGQAGQVDVEFLPDDKGTGEDRYLFGIGHQSHLGASWRATLDGRAVSDSQYFEDLYNGIAASSQTHLERVFDLEHYGDIVSVLVRFQSFETLDESLRGPDKPYRRVPQVVANAYVPDGALGLDWRLDSEVSYFERNDSVTGGRLHLAPSLSWPIAWRGLRFEPAAALDYTAYSLDNTADGADDTPDRAAPVLSANLGTVFERGVRGSDGWLQTLEPRIQYIYIPFRNQDDLPVFDTIEPDFNLVALFRDNRFLGHDRLGDTSELNIGLTTRVLDASSGSQYLTATVGQSRYFKDQEVTLPGGPPIINNSSDWLAELGLNVNERWKFDLGYQWDADAGQSQKFLGRIQYRRDSRRAANIAYRYRRDTLEEIDLSAAWPISDRWSAVARYNYSILDEEPLERFVGAEYQTCCWGVRVVYQRYVATRTGETDTAIALQLILKGLTNASDPAERVLGRGILGYDRD